MASNIHSTAPDAYIEFFPFKQERTKGLSRSELMEVNSVLVHKELLSVSTTKSKGGSGWTAVLSPQKNFKTILQPGCWCVIYISNQQLNGTEDASPGGGLKMLGIVRSIRAIEETAEASGHRSIRYEVSGDDFQGVLNTQIYINSVLADASNLGETTAEYSQLTRTMLQLEKNFRKANSPANMVNGLLNSFLGPLLVEGKNGTLHPAGSRAGMPYLVPGSLLKRFQGGKAGKNKAKGVQALGGTFNGLLKRFLQSDLLGITAIPAQVGSQFTIWSIVQTYVHTVLNECYTDLVPTAVGSNVQLAPAVILRAIPFSSHAGVVSGSTKSIVSGNHTLTNTDYFKSGIQLYVSKEIEESDIISFNYGRTDLERTSFWFVVPVFSQGSTESEASIIGRLTKAGHGINDIGDTNSMSRYGIRPFIRSSNYLVNADNAPIVSTNLIIRDMWRDAHLYDNGTVRLRGSAEHIPVGTNIRFPGRNWIAHVEQVSHMYSVAPDGRKQFRTSVNFVRLQTLAGKPIDESLPADTPRGEFDPGISGF